MRTAFTNPLSLSATLLWGRKIHLAGTRTEFERFGRRAFVGLFLFLYALQHCTYSFGEKDISRDELSNILNNAYSKYTSSIETLYAVITIENTAILPFELLPDSLQRRLISNLPGLDTKSEVQDSSVSDIHLWFDRHSNNIRIDTKMTQRRYGGYVYPNQDPQPQLDDSSVLLTENKYFKYDKRKAYGQQSGLWIFSREQSNPYNASLALDPMVFFKVAFDREYPGAYIDEYCAKLPSNLARFQATMMDSKDIHACFEIRERNNEVEDFTFSSAHGYLLSKYIHKDVTASKIYEVEWHDYGKGDQHLYFPRTAVMTFLKIDNGRDSLQMKRIIHFNEVNLNERLPREVFTLESFDMAPETMVLDRFNGNNPQNYQLGFSQLVKSIKPSAQMLDALGVTLKDIELTKINGPINTTAKSTNITPGTTNASAPSDGSNNVVSSESYHVYLILSCSSLILLLILFGLSVISRHKQGDQNTRP